MDGNSGLVDLIECFPVDRIDCLVDFDCCRIVTLCPADCMFVVLADSIQMMVYRAVTMESHWMLTVGVVDYYLSMFHAAADDIHCRTHQIDCQLTVAAVAAVADCAVFVGGVADAAAANFGNYHQNRNCLPYLTVE